MTKQMTEQEIREDERLQSSIRLGCKRCKEQGAPKVADPKKDYRKRNGGTVSTSRVHRDGKYFTGCPYGGIFDGGDE
jgi:hypothetical protein